MPVLQHHSVCPFFIFFLFSLIVLDRYTSLAAAVTIALVHLQRSRRITIHVTEPFRKGCFVLSSIITRAVGSGPRASISIRYHALITILALSLGLLY